MKFAKSVLLGSLLIATAGVPAQSQGMMDILGNLAGKYVISWSDLDTKRSQIDTTIQEAVKAGKLSAAQATDFRIQLDKIAQAETEARLSGKRISITQGVSFGNELSSLATSIQDAINNKVSSLPDIDTAQVQLATQIDAAVASGHVTQQTAASLKAQLKGLADIESAYKTETGGNLTPRQVEILSEQFNRIKADADQQIRVGQSAVPVINEKRAAIEKKLSDMLVAGRITSQQSATFTTDLQKIATEQTFFQNANNGSLTGAQVLKLAQELDAVNERVDALYVGSATGAASTVELDSRRRELGSRVRTLVQNGQISREEAMNLRSDLNRISDNAESMQVSGILTSAQVANLMGQLNQVGVQVERLAQRPPSQVNAYPNVGQDYRGPGPDYRGSGPDYRDDRDYRGGGGRRWQGRDRDRYRDNQHEDDEDVAVNVGAGTQVDTDETPPATSTISLPIIAQKNFSDIGGYWGEQYVVELASRGVIGGFPNGTFGPNNEITRAQFAAIVTNALRLPATSGGARSFTDVKAGYWAAPAIAAASDAGLIGGFPDGTFRPEDKITRAQSLVILSKALGGAAPSNQSALAQYTDQAAVPSWAAADLARAAAAHVIVSFPDPNQIRPNALATRGDVAALMYQTLTAKGANLPKLRIGLR